MSSKLLGAERSEISCNCRVKHYPDGSQQLTAFSADILRLPGWEEQHPRKRQRRQAEGDANDPESLARARRRARGAVTDIALSNEFRYFVTLTLDRQKVDRYDVGEVTKKLNNWLDNNVRRKGLKYVLVPELHKDGAVHFHGFFNDALPAVDSGTLTTKGKPRKPRSKAERQRMLDAGAHVVYNLPAWSLGFSTAIELYGDRRAAVGYVCKYISKAADKVGGRWYYSGGDLMRPEVTYHSVTFKELCDEYAAIARPYKVEVMGCWGITVNLEESE